MVLMICFIDDSDFEHDLVRNEVAPYASGLDLVQAYTFDEARELLGPKIPVLFLLDLWGQDMSVREPYVTPKGELEKRISDFNTLDMVYDGLEDLNGDRTNEYLKRLFSIVDSWRNLFEEVCDNIGQNRKYGLANLQHVRKYYPWVPAVFYTRKSLINDAVAMFKAGADGLMIKPTGRDDAETRILTREYAPKLIEELARIIDSKIDNINMNGSSYRAEMREKEKAGEDLISSWKEFRNK
jgi:DNA-binding NarL/FixJ family response regulator